MKYVNKVFKGIMLFLVLQFLLFSPAKTFSQEIKNGTVTIPFADFKEIWEKITKEKEVPPPNAYVFNKADFLVTAVNSTAQINLEISINVLDKNWVKVPVFSTSGFNGNITETKILESSSEFLFSQEGSTIYLIGRGPQLVKANISYQIPISMQKGKNVLSLHSTSALVNKLELQLEGDSLNIESYPEISQKIVAENGKTNVLSFLSGNTDISFYWQKEDGSQKLPLKNRVTNSTLISIGEGQLIASSNYVFEIVQGETSEIKVVFPNDISVINVYGNNISNWKVDEGKKEKQLIITLVKPISDYYNCTVSYEKSMGKTSFETELPIGIVQNIERETGFVGVEARTNVEIETKSIDNATQIDIKELPSNVWSSAYSPIVLGFKYLKTPAIAISVKKHQDLAVLVAAIDLEKITTVMTSEGKALTSAVFNVRNNLKQFLKLTMPEGTTVWSTLVNNSPVKPAKGEKGEILIPLQKSQEYDEGIVSFPVEVVYLSESLPFVKDKEEIKEFILPLADIPANKLYWEVYLPLNFKYKDFNGNVNPTTEVLGINDTETTTTSSYDSPKKMKEKDKGASNVQTQIPQGMQNEINTGFSRGVLPVKINVPTEGILFRFSKLLITKDNPTLSFKYKAEKKK